MRLDIEQDTQEWLNLRKEKITSSDASILMGNNKFGGNSPYLLWQKKMGLADDPMPTNKMMEGSEMEDIILEIFETQTDKKLIRKDGMIDKPVYQSDEHPWMIASLDGQINEKEYVEAKGGEKAYQEAAKANIPDYIYDQVQHTMLVKGFDLCHLCFYRVGKDLIHMTVNADKEYQQNILKAELEFYQHMKTCTAPEDTTALVVEDTEAYDLALYYEDAYTRSKAVEKELDIIAAKLKKYAKERSVKIKGTNVSVIKVRSSFITDWNRVQIAYSITNEDLRNYKKEKAGYDKIEVRAKK